MAMPTIQTIQGGELHWTSVDVVDIAIGTEGVALRAALEQFQIQVRRFPVGQARHLLKVLSGDEAAARHVILSCHGDEGGIVLPELAEQFEAMQPVHGVLTAEKLRGRVHLPGRVVIATGCQTGNPELAHAFLDGGCAAYIGPADGPYGDTVVVAMVLLFHELMRGRTLADSMARVRSYDDELSAWQLWEREVSQAAE